VELSQEGAARGALGFGGKMEEVALSRAWMVEAKATASAKATSAVMQVMLV
jgi:hypothetical protein